MLESKDQGRVIYGVLTLMGTRTQNGPTEVPTEKHSWLRMAAGTQRNLAPPTLNTHNAFFRVLLGKLVGRADLNRICFSFLIVFPFHYMCCLAI